MFGVLDEQGFPQVPVFDRFLGGCFPAAPLPVFEPAVVEGFFEVGAVRVERNAAALFEDAEGF